MTSRVAWLLAGLILAVHLGAPMVGRGLARAGAPIAPRDADPADPDAESDGDEAPTSEVDLLLFARGRSPRLGPARSPRGTESLQPWAVASGSPARRPGLAHRAGGPPGHFLAEGRPLRHWVQSLTC
jgi:hypothetical protein